MFKQGARPRKAACSTHTRAEEKDATVQEEADSAKDEAKELQAMKKTPITGKLVEIQEECSKEGGASMLDQVDKTTQWNAEITR